MKYNLQHFVEDKELIKELLPLTNDHGRTRIGDQKYAPKIERFLAGWKSGQLRLVLARDEATNKLVGYQVWGFHEMLFETGQRAVLGPIYLVPEYRGKDIKGFVNYGVDTMIILGAQDIRVECDADQPTEQIFARQGWTKMSVQMKRP